MPECPAAHVFPVRVYYEDTDAGGIVYYANYLKFAERARTELLRERGVEHGTLRGKHEVAFTVRSCAVDFHRPARLDDMLEVHTRLIDVRKASMAAEQIVRRDGEVLVRMTVRLACVGPNGRPRRMPAGLREALLVGPDSF